MRLLCLSKPLPKRQDCNCNGHLPETKSHVFTLRGMSKLMGVNSKYSVGQAISQAIPAKVQKYS